MQLHNNQLSLTGNHSSKDRKEFSKENIDFIREMYPSSTCREIAAALQRSEISVKEKISRMIREGKLTHKHPNKSAARKTKKEAKLHPLETINLKPHLPIKNSSITKVRCTIMVHDKDLTKVIKNFSSLPGARIKFG